MTHTEEARQEQEDRTEIKWCHKNKNLNKKKINLPLWRLIVAVRRCEDEGRRVADLYAKPNAAGGEPSFAFFRNECGNDIINK